jgi:hypothetical protein
VRVIRGAVERIDDPAFVTRAGVRAAFFPEDRALGKTREQALDDQRFACPVRKRDKIAARALLPRLERPVRAREQERARFASGVDCEV